MGDKAAAAAAGMLQQTGDRAFAFPLDRMRSASKMSAKREERIIESHLVHDHPKVIFAWLFQ